MSMTQESARPVRPVTDAERDALCERIRAGWRAWCTAWGAEATAGEVTCREAVLADSRDAWVAFEGLGYVGVTDEHGLGLDQLLFGSSAQRVGKYDVDGRSSVASEVVSSAMAALKQGIAQALLANGAGLLAQQTALLDQAPIASMFEPFSGCLVASIRVGGNDAVRFLCRVKDVAVLKVTRNPELAPLSSALGTQSVHMTLTIGELSMSLGDLAMVSVGDVLPLQSRIDRPLKVELDDGTVPFFAFVGRHEHQLAMRVTASRETLT